MVANPSTLWRPKAACMSPTCPPAGQLQVRAHSCQAAYLGAACTLLLQLRHDLSKLACMLTGAAGSLQCWALVAIRSPWCRGTEPCSLLMQLGIDLGAQALQVQVPLGVQLLRVVCCSVGLGRIQAAGGTTGSLGSARAGGAGLSGRGAALRW